MSFLRGVFRSGLLCGFERWACLRFWPCLWHGRTELWFCFPASPSALLLFFLFFSFSGLARVFFFFFFFFFFFSSFRLLPGIRLDTTGRFCPCRILVSLSLSLSLALFFSLPGPAPLCLSSASLSLSLFFLSFLHADIGSSSSSFRSFPRGRHNSSTWAMLVCRIGDEGCT